MMAELFLLLKEIKARAITLFWLTLSEIDLPDCDYSEAEKKNPIVSNAQQESETRVEKASSQFKIFFLENISNKKYNIASKMMEDNNNTSLQSTYTILNPMKELVGRYEITNSEYGKEDESIPSQQSLSQNLERTKNGEMQLKNNTKTPEFFIWSKITTWPSNKYHI